ncbi:MAG: electron transfer flavoprotein subunit beta/FixA family protein [Sulfolobaceae archaeon]
MLVIVGFKIVPDDSLIKIVGNELKTDVPVKISTYDKNAIEEAIKIKEATNGKAIGITVGITDRKSIREALAMGLDEIIAINTQYADVKNTALIIAEHAKQLNPDVILFGESTTDSSTGSLGGYVAGVLEYPYVSYVRKLKIEGKKLILERALTPIYEKVEVETPVVISVTGEINVPRIPTVRQIMEASKKPVKEIKIDKLDNSAKIHSIKPYIVTRKRIIIEKPMDEAVEILLDYLKKEGVL